MPSAPRASKGTSAGHGCSKRSQRCRGRSALVLCGVCLGFYLPLKQAVHIKRSAASARPSTEGTGRTGYKKAIWCLSSFQQKFLILDITKPLRQSCCFPRPSSKSARARKCTDSGTSSVIPTFCGFAEQTPVQEQRSRKQPIRGVPRTWAPLLARCSSGAAR